MRAVLPSVLAALRVPGPRAACTQALSNLIYAGSGRGARRVAADPVHKDMALLEAMEAGQL
jgi:hypothetical protein